MVKSNRINGIFWLVFSLVIARESYRLGLGNLHSPEAGFLPFAASIILGVLSFFLLLFTKSRKQQPSEKMEDVTFNRERMPKVLYAIISLFLYSIFLNAFGFVLVSVILMAFLLRAIEPQKWYVITLGAILIPVFAYLLFDVLPKVQLPKGFLGI